MGGWVGKAYHVDVFLSLLQTHAQAIDRVRLQGDFVEGGGWEGGWVGGGGS